MIKCILAGAGGAIGAVLRYLIGLIPVDPENGFPIKTFFINIAGCFLIGIIAALAEKHSLSPEAVVFIKVGICGGFTTFSSFALETEGLLAGGRSWTALLYVILSLICGVLAVLLAEKIIIR